MRTIQAILLTGISLVSTGCSSKQVQLYAEKLDTYLTEYRASMKSQIDAEGRVYDQIGAVFATEAERDVYEGLKIERLRQQRIVTGDLIDGRMKPSQVTERIRATTLNEFETSKAWFEQELTVQQKYQSGIAKLAMDAKKLDALDSALKAVEKNSDLKTALTDVIAMSKTFRNEFQVQGCKNLQSSVGVTTASSAELTAQLKTAEATLSTAAGLEKAEVAADMEALKGQLATLSATLTANQTALKARKCS